MHTSLKKIMTIFTNNIMSSPLQQLAQLALSLDQTLEPASINTLTVAIHTLDELFVLEPKQIAQNIGPLLDILENMILDQTNSWLLDRAHLLDFIVMVIQRFPKLVTNNKPRATKIYKLALNILAQISTDLTEDWMNPPNGYKENTGNDVDQQASKQVMTSIDQLNQVLSFNQALLHIQPLFLQYIQKTEDWRYQYAALMGASQLAIENSSAEQLGIITQWALAEAEHNHPKVRYAALQLLGQYSDDLSPEFEQLYFDTFVPLSVKLLSDGVPRVVAHTFACVTNFFQKCNELWKLQSCLGQYLTPIIHYIRTGNTWIKQTALSVLSSFAMTEDAFGPNLLNIFQLAFGIISTFAGQEPYKQVISLSFQLLSMLLINQKRKLVQNFLHQFIKQLFDHQQNIQNDFFLRAWQRLCIQYKDFTDLTPIYPVLLNTNKHMITSTYSDDQCADGLKCLQSTFNSFKIKLVPFAQETILFAKSIFQTKTFNIKFRQQGLNLIISIISNTKPQESEFGQWYTQTYAAYNYLITTIQGNINQEIYIQQLECLFQGVQEIVISLGNFLTSADLIAIVEKLIGLVVKLENQYKHTQGDKTEAQSFNDDDELDSNNSEIILAEQTMHYLEHAFDIIPDILKELLKLSTQPTTKMQIVSILQQEIQISINKQVFMVLFSLNLSVTILESLSYIDISQIWGKLIEIYVKFSQHSHPRIRNGGVYGLNLIFNKTPPGILGQNEIKGMLTCLSTAFTTPFQDTNDTFFNNHCKDNVIAALGALLKFYNSQFSHILTFEVYGYWLSNLPLCTDKLQGDSQQQLLIETLATTPNLLIKEAKDLKVICQIYSKFIMNRKEKEGKQIVQRTKESLLLIKEWSLFKESTDYLWNNLTNSQQKALTQLMNS